MTTVVTGPDVPVSPISRLWRRELDHYPGLRTRVVSLSIVVLTTVLFYYQYYVISGVGTQLLSQTHMSFTYYVNINVVSALLSALTSVAAGITDRYGRANVVTVGVLLCALVCLLGFPFAHTALAVAILYGLLGALEGVVLVATPALVRDFSPQVGRASAMGFWTLGPVVGSLVVSVVVSNTASHLDAWQDQYVIAGIAGLVVFVISALWLRELSPGLRDQVLRTEQEAALAEARARGIDVEAALKRPFRQMLHLDVVGSAIGISVFLIIYFTAVGFFPIFFQTVFGYSESKANAVGNWIWAFEAGALILIGFLSDRLRVRKPFMLVGAVGAVVTTVLLILRTSRPETSYYHFVVILTLLAIFLGMTFAPWMASFTETVERRNPALTATGLSVWGLTIRLVVTVSVFITPFVVGSVTPLVNDGPRVQALAAGQSPDLNGSQNAIVKAVAADPAIVTKVQALAAKYDKQLATAAKLDPATQTALGARPDDQAVQAKAISEITKQPLAIVTKVVALGTRYSDQVTTAGTIDEKTQVAVLTNRSDAAARTKAIGEIAAGLKVTPAVASTKLDALLQVPIADLLYLSANAGPALTAADQLTALGNVPAADLDYLTKYGQPLQDPKVQTELRYLEAKGGTVQKAVTDAPKQWQRYFWIAVAGQLVFIPLIFLMAGFWDPRAARRFARESDARAAAELAATRTDGARA